MMDDDSTSRRTTHFSEKSRFASSGGTSNPRPEDLWSVFGDEACGEPEFAQHVVIDFTPNDEDNEIIQKKVCSFWEFINNTPEIQNLKVKPVKEQYNYDSDTGVASVSVKSRSKPDDQKKGHEHEEAVKMLQFAEQKMHDIKLPHIICPAGSYSEATITQPKKQKKIKHVCKSKPCRHPNCPNKGGTAMSKEELALMKELNQKMNEFDAKHPKSMEPPGHPPPLQHCVIERQAFPRPL